MEAVKKLLSIIPGVELVEHRRAARRDPGQQPRRLPKFKHELIERELAAVAEAGVDILATVYHAYHREFATPATAAASRSSTSWSSSARRSASTARTYTSG